MASEKLSQVYAANATTTIDPTDLIYVDKEGLVDAGMDGTAFGQLFQKNVFTHGTDTGAVNAYIVNLSPAVTGLTNGLIVSFTPTHNNTIGAPVLQINALANKIIYLPNLDSLRPGDLATNVCAYLLYSSGIDAFILLNPRQSFVSPGNIQDQVFSFGNAAGSANAITLSLSPAVGGYVSGMLFGFKALNDNTTATTVDVNGVGAVSIYDNQGAALIGGEIIAGITYLIQYNDTLNGFVLINSSLGSVSPKEVQQWAYNIGIDTSVITDVYTITLNPTLTSYTDGLVVEFIPLQNNGTAQYPTLSIDGLAPKNIVLLNYDPLQLFDIQSDVATIVYYSLSYDAFILLTPQASFVKNYQVQQVLFNFGYDGGTTNTYQVNLTPALTTYAAAMPVFFYTNNTNTSSSTLSLNGLTPVNIVCSNRALAPGDIQGGHTYLCIYDFPSGTWILMTPKTNPVVGSAAPYNLLINGSFNVWQRGTTFTDRMSTGDPAIFYSADRWGGYRAGNVAGFDVSQQAVSTTDRGNQLGNYAFRWQRTVGNASANTMYMWYSMESNDSYQLAGQTITFSVYAKVGADYSGSTFNFAIYSGTGINQRVDGYTGSLNSTFTNAAVNGTLQRFTNTYTVPTNATEVGLRLDWTPSGTAGANDYIDLIGAQLEIGNTATPLIIRPFEEELTLCQRYFCKSFPTDVTPANNAGLTGAITTKAPQNRLPYLSVYYKQTMLQDPNVNTYNPSAANSFWRDITSSTDFAVDVGPGFTSGPDGFFIQTTGVVTTAADLVAVHYTADAEI